MSNRKIASVEINGKNIWVEVDQVDVIAPGTRDGDHPSDLRGSATPVGNSADLLKGKIATVAETLEAIVSTIDKGIDKLNPDEWSIELNMGFAGEQRIPYIAKSEINGCIKVVAKWKKSTS
jgi:hypothetical protein